MVVSSIQVSAATRERLRKYKMEGMSYDDVLRILLEILPPNEFQRLYRAYQKRVMAAIRARGEWTRLDGSPLSATPRKLP